MKIACEACGAKYTIADDKVRGRKVKIRCKGCGTPIVVDGQQGQPGGGPSLSDAEAETALEADGPTIWSVNLTDTDSRTMSVEEIVAGYSSGLVTADAFVWKDGMTDWIPVLNSELAPLLQGAPAPAPTPAPAAAPAALAPVAAAPTATAPVAAGRGTMPLFAAPNLAAVPVARPAAGAARPAAARVQAQADNTQDLFGGIDAAGSDEEEVATSAPVVPQAGASAYDDGKMTGARNENSVLFSLDALKAGFSPSAPSGAAKPAPKAPKGPTGGRPQQPSNPDDPFGMGASAGIMGTGGGALFGADNHALLTAPAPPPPPAPTPAQFAAGAPPTAYSAPPQKNKLVLIGGAVGGGVIIVLLLMLVLGRKHEAAPETDGSALAQASAAPSAAADKPVEAKKEDEPPKTEDKPAESAAPPASASAAPDTKPADKPVAVAVKSDAAKKPKDEPAAPAADAPPFSKASAISALSAAASSAGTCKKPGGPTGSGKATITFAPSGRVTTATVSGSFAGTPVGGCVASVFRRAHVPAFSGSAVTVSKSFSIN